MSEGELYEENKTLEVLLRALEEGNGRSDARRNVEKEKKTEDEVTIPKARTAERRDTRREAIGEEETSKNENIRGGNSRTGGETPPEVTIEERLDSNGGESTPKQKRTNPSGIGAARRVADLTTEEQKLALTQIVVGVIQEISRKVASKSSEIVDKARKKLEAATMISKVERNLNKFILGVLYDFPDYERINPTNYFERKMILKRIMIHVILDIEKELWEILWMLSKDVRYPSEDGKIDIFFTVIPQLILTRLGEIRLDNDKEIFHFRNDLLYRDFKVQSQVGNQGEENFPRYTSLTFPMLCIEKNGELFSRKDFWDRWESMITEILNTKEITIQEIKVCLEVYRFYLLQIFYVIKKVKEQYVDVEMANKFADRLISGKMQWILDRIEAMESEVNSQ